MNEIKMEFASLEEHDNVVRKAIERRAYTLYESDGSKDGYDQEHWLRAERELMIQDVPLSIENDVVAVRLAIEDFPASALIMSVSARSVLIFSLRDDADADCDDTSREILRIISLPFEIDAARVTCELDDSDLALSLPLAAGAPAISNDRKPCHSEAHSGD
jgi:hypothetical protein